MKKLFFLMLAVLLLGSCTTEVELCESDHPHRKDVKFYFDFGSFKDNPDSIYIFAVRNLNFLRYSFHLDAQGETTQAATGQLLFSDVQREQLPDSVNDRICLHVGDYEMVAFSGESDVFENNLNEIMQDKSSMKVDSLWVMHKSYRTTRDHPLLMRDSAWVSHNLYSDFILSGDQKPTYMSYDTLSVPLSEETSTVSKTFKMNDLSQHIQLNFYITKDVNVVIDSLIAELSGIPHKMYLLTGVVDVSRTFKTLFRPRVEPQNNSQQTQVKVVGDLYVNGIVHSANPTYTTGPGVLWVNVFAHVTLDDGTVVSRPIEACINLYNVLKNNPSLRLNQANEALKTTNNLVLEIPGALLNVKKWALESHSNDGLDVWQTLPDGTGNIGVDL